MAEIANPIITARLKFPGTAVPSADANTLDEYREGTWTPTDASGASLSFTTSACTYVKVGRLVFAAFNITYPSTANSANTSIGGLPFTVRTGASSTFPAIIGFSNHGAQIYALTTQGTTTFQLFDAAGVARQNSNMTAKNIRGMVIYEADA